MLLLAMGFQWRSLSSSGWDQQSLSGLEKTPKALNTGKNKDNIPLLSCYSYIISHKKGGHKNSLLWLDIRDGLINAWDVISGQDTCFLGEKLRQRVLSLQNSYNTIQAIVLPADHIHFCQLLKYVFWHIDTFFSKEGTLYHISFEQRDVSWVERC